VLRKLVELVENLLLLLFAQKAETGPVCLQYLPDVFGVLLDFREALMFPDLDTLDDTFEPLPANHKHQFEY
jgi:hypothetical protein